MSLYFVRHQTFAEHCPAKDPRMGSMLLQNLYPAQTHCLGIQVHGGGVVNEANTLISILEGEDQTKLEEYQQPFQQFHAGEFFPASFRERVVERKGC